MSTGYFSVVFKGHINYLYHYHHTLEINIFPLPGSRFVSTPSQSQMKTKKHLTLALFRKKRYYTIGFEIDNRIGKIQNKGRTNGDPMKKLFIPITFFLILSLTGTYNLHPLENPSISIIGPSFSKHFATSYSGFNYFHPGIGGEFQTSFKKWIFGFHGYYMFKDSLDHKAYWTGITAGYRFGSKQKLWCEPFMIIGGIKKMEYHSGKFGFFALPVLSIGYNRFGFNVGYIPKIPNVTNPILIVQAKLRLLSFK
jgi:hypothetical protein